MPVKIPSIFISYLFAIYYPTELKKAENAWKSKLKGAEEQDPVKALERDVRAILNKLCPQNFDKLVKKFNELTIDTEVKLKACIELIFEKVRLMNHHNIDTIF